MKNKLLKNLLKKSGIKHKYTFKKPKRMSMPDNKLLEYDVNVRFNPKAGKRMAKKAWQKGGKEFSIATGASVLGAGIYANLPKKRKKRRKRRSK